MRQDNTETNLINLRRTIYLTIMSGLTFEETGHKLMKIELAPGQEFEVASMILECCSQEKTFSKCARATPCLCRHPPPTCGPASCPSFIYDM